MTTVDITILSWDRLEETKAAIASALAQQGVELRVIVIDQGSQAQSLEALQQFCSPFPQITLVCNERNLGVPGGRNQAAHQGQGDYIVALDNDAEFSDAHQVSRAVAIMEQQPDLGAIGFRILCHGTDSDDLSSWSYGQNPREWAHVGFYTAQFVGAGHMIRRSAFERVDGYDECLFFMEEEAELARKLINCGYRIRYSPEVVIGHKVSTERRVHWSGSRWRYHVRNRLYLNLKFRMPLPSLGFSLFLMLYKGARAGLLLDTLTGLSQALALLPRARRAIRWPGVKSTPRGEAYIRSCAQGQGLPRWERMKRRLKKAGMAPGTSAH